MTSANVNFRHDDSWWMANADELRRVYQAIIDDAKAAAMVKPGEPGFSGSWPHAESLGYARDSMAFNIFHAVYQRNL